MIILCDSWTPDPNGSQKGSATGILAPNWVPLSAGVQYLRNSLLGDRMHNPIVAIPNQLVTAVRVAVGVPE